jgi:hypothetical protein
MEGYLSSQRSSVASRAVVSCMRCLATWCVCACVRAYVRACVLLRGAEGGREGGREREREKEGEEGEGEGERQGDLFKLLATIEEGKSLRQLLEHEVRVPQI